MWRRALTVLFAALVATSSVVPAASATSGGGWYLRPVPGPDGAPLAASPELALTCPAVTSCELLTQYQYVTTLDGRAATTVDPPEYYTDPHLTNALRDIACAQVGDCVATGETYEGPWDTPGGYRDELSHGTWTAEKGTPAYQQVACNSERCVEIGTQYVGVDRGVLDDRAAGGHWVARSLTTPWQTARDNGFYIGMDAVACPPSGPCYAVGHAEPAYQDPARSLFFSRNGRGIWHGVPIADPAGATPASAYLGEGLSCPATRTCLALGTYVDAASGDERAFVETYANGRLSATALPMPPGPVATTMFADDVSCVSAADCAGVITWFGAGRLLHQALLRYHAGAWTSQVVSPAGAAVGSAPYVFAAACSSASRCLAVGRFFKGTSGGLVNTPAVWTWRASSGWTVRLLPTPKGLAADANGELTDITCPGTSRCYVDGSYDGKAVYGVSS
jgi:hypothetical protein